MDRRQINRHLLLLLAAGLIPGGLLPRAALAKNGSDDGGSGSDDSGGSNSGSGSSGSGSSGSGSSGSGSSGSGSSGSGSSGPGSSGPGGGSSNRGNGSSRDGDLLRRDAVAVSYRDGAYERIIDGRFVSVDKSGRVREDRRASPADAVRMRAASLGRQGDGRVRESLIRVDGRDAVLEVVDRSGWREVITAGRYTLTDPNGNVVTRREVRARDLDWIQSLLGAD